MDSQITLLSALLLGLFGGVHCVGMCGGIVTALTFSTDPSANRNQRLFIQLAYNLGRISSYTLFGFIAGALSQFSQTLFINVHLVQHVLQFVAALFLLAMGLYLGGWWTGLIKLEQLGQYVWKYIEPRARHLLPIRSWTHAILVGMVWGWLPCGLVYSAAFYALSSGSAYHGGILMMSFGIGTLPTLLASGMLANNLTKLLRQLWTRRIAGLFVILCSLVLFYRYIS